LTMYQRSLFVVVATTSAVGLQPRFGRQTMRMDLGAVDYGAVLSSAGRRALGGGASGAAAGVVQVVSLMWLRTAMNYEYRYGGEGMVQTVGKLYEEGGIPRLYRGVGFALFQSPLSRFGDAAANAAVPQLLTTLGESGVIPALPLATTQAAASFAAATWRIAITPIDTLKTSLQVQGNLTALQSRIDTKGVAVLWSGALAAALATLVGNYPWFLTYNSLDGALPPADGQLETLLRRALLGVAASSCSDVCSNSLRVVKTGLQTIATESAGDDPLTTAAAAPGPIDVAKAVIDADGIAGLFGRGLQTRLAVNCIQGAVFSVAWKYFESILVVPS